MKSMASLRSLPLLVLLLVPSSSLFRNPSNRNKHLEPLAYADGRGYLRALFVFEEVHSSYAPKEKDTVIIVAPGTGDNEEEETPNNAPKDIEEEKGDGDTGTTEDRGPTDTDGTEEGEKVQDTDSNSTEDSNEKQDTPSSKEDSYLDDKDGETLTGDNDVKDPIPKEQPVPQGFGESTPRTNSQLSEKDYTWPMIGVIVGSSLVIMGTIMFVFVFIYRRKANQELTDVIKHAESAHIKGRSSSGSTQGLPSTGSGSFEDDRSEEASILSYIRSLSTAMTDLYGSNDAANETEAHDEKVRSKNDSVDASISVLGDDYMIPRFELDDADEMSLDFSYIGQISVATSAGGTSVSDTQMDTSLENAP